MPFKSEAQRRYLWANEPEIARDWTDTYGSRIHKNNGGIMSMQGGVKNYLGEQPMVNAPKYWQSAPDHETTELAYITPQERDVLVNMNMYGTMNGSPNEGPSGLMSLNGWGDKEQGFGMSDTGQGITGTGGHSYGDQETRSLKSPDSPDSDPGYTTTSPKDTFEQSWSGQPGFLGFGGGYRNLKTPGVTPERGGAYQSRFGIGNLFRGAMSMFGGWPGRIGSLLSRINPNQYREKLTGYKTQQEYEDARAARINEKRIGNILSRKAPITEMTQENLRKLGYSGDMPGVGSTDLSRAIDKDYTMEDTLREYSITPNRIAELQNQNKLPYEQFTDDIALSKQMGSLQSDAIPYEEFGITNTDQGNEFQENIYPDIESHTAKSDIAPEFKNLIRHAGWDFWNKDKEDEGINEAEVYGGPKRFTYQGKTYEMPSKIYPSKGEYQLEGRAMENYIKKNTDMKNFYLESPNMIPAKDLERMLVGENV